MPRIDPRLATIMASSVILSTLLVATIVKPKAEDALLVLGNEYPQALVKRAPAVGLDSELSFSFMATRDFERVELRFSSLFEKDLDANVSASISLHELPNVAKVEGYVTTLGGDAEMMEADIELNGTRYEATILDFSRFLEAFNNGSMMATLPLVFAMLVRGDEVRYFEGCPGFFMEAEQSLQYLTISRGDDKKEYIRSGTMLKEVPRTSEAPRDGVLVFDTVKRDERFSVSFTIDIPEDGLRQIVTWVPERHLLELVQGYSDGERAVLLVDPMQRGVKQ